MEEVLRPLPCGHRGHWLSHHRRLPRRRTSRTKSITHRPAFGSCRRSDKAVSQLMQANWPSHEIKRSNSSLRWARTPNYRHVRGSSFRFRYRRSRRTWPQCLGNFGDNRGNVDVLHEWGICMDLVEIIASVHFKESRPILA